MGKRIFRKEPTEGRRIFTGSKRPKADTAPPPPRTSKTKTASHLSKRPKADTAPPPRAKTGEVKGSSEDSSSSNQKK